MPNDPAYSIFVMCIYLALIAPHLTLQKDYITVNEILYHIHETGFVGILFQIIIMSDICTIVIYNLSRQTLILFNKSIHN